MKLKILGAIVGFGVLLVLWQAAAANVNPALFPGPVDALRGIADLARGEFPRWNIWDSIGRSLYRFGFGYLLAVAIGIPLGMFLGYFKSVWPFINPVVQVLRPISPIAWLPFAMVWFGIGAPAVIFIVFIAAFFPIMLNTVSAVGKIDKNYYKLGKNFGISPLATFWKIIFPAAFPHIATGLHIAIGSSWVFIVAGEMLGVQEGLGFLILDTRNGLRNDLLMSVMIIIGLLGFMIDSLVGWLERRVYKKWGML